MCKVTKAKSPTANGPRNFLGRAVWDMPVTGPHLAKTVIGSVIERLVARTISALLWDSTLPAFKVPANVALESDSSLYELRPDAWWPAHYALVEIKCGIARFYVTERQWNSYCWARDTQNSGLPVTRPRVFYAFVSYMLDKRTAKYGGTYELIDAALTGLQYIVVADSRLVTKFIDESGSYGADHVGPLSPMLGIWNAHWNVRAHKLRAWASVTREQLAAKGMARWRVKNIIESLRVVGVELAEAGWAQIPLVPAVVLYPCRRVRPGATMIPGSQTTLFGTAAEDRVGESEEDWYPEDEIYTPF